MNLKTFTANSMAEALLMVKKALGANAVILHTRKYKRGGVLGIGAREVVEVTAADQVQVSPRKGAAPAPRRAPAPRPAPAATHAESTNAGDLIRRTYAAAQAQLQQQLAAAAPPAPAQPSPPGPAPSAMPASPASPAAPTSEGLADEMRAVRRMVERMMHEQKRRADTQPQSGDIPDQLFDQYLNLLKQEVTEELAEQVIGQVRDRLAPEQFEDASQVRKAVLASIAELIPTEAEPQPPEQPADRRPRTIALIGPTGVGKTTTIAKLAATFKLKQKKNVALITLDTYRIAAVDQLRTYASILGVPLHVVVDPSELATALRLSAGCDVVLIDTAGRSQRDDPRLEQLKTFIDAADPHEVHLVLSSTCTQRVLLNTVERFSTIGADRIIFTKLDEAVSFGVLLNVIRKVNKRLSYVTTGQEVPHQIEPGRPDRLAELVLDGVAGGEGQG